jgi:soluble cytochrome b562
MSEGVIIAIVGSVAGILGVVIPVVRIWRKSPSRSVTDQVTIASAAEGVIRVYVDALDRNTAETQAMRAELADAERRIDRLESNLHKAETSLAIFKHGVGILISQLRRLNVVPEWTPTD